MRKKSHIALTSYLICNLDRIEFNRHKYSFYIGSLLPDCVPSFLTKKHCIDDTFDILKKEIENITITNDVDKGVNSYYFLKLGVITHFIADYFTYPHNSIYKGNLAAHCYYEKEQKYAIRNYLKNIDRSIEKVYVNNNEKQNLSVEEICNYIKQKHEEYLQLDIVLTVDCEYIVNVCKNVVDNIIHIFELRLEEMRVKEIKVA